MKKRPKISAKPILVFSTTKFISAAKAKFDAKITHVFNPFSINNLNALTH